MPLPSSKRTPAPASPPRPAIRQSQYPCNRLTVYLKNSGTLEKVAAMANHDSTRTTQLCARRYDEMTLDEVEKIGI